MPKKRIDINSIVLDFSESLINSDISEETKVAFQKSSPLTDNWLEQIAKEKTTWLRYVRAFYIYSKSTGLSAEELLSLKEDYGDLRAELLLEKWLTQFDKAFPRLHPVTKKNLGRPLGEAISIAVKSFYTYNGKALARKRGRYCYSKVRPKVKWKREDLLTFSEGLYIREKAIVGLCSCVPARLSTLVSLDWRHVQEIFDENIEFPHVYIEAELLKEGRKFTQLEQHSFMHSWARKLLLEWREEYQKLTGKTISPSIPESMNLPLFITKIPYKRGSPNSGEYNRLKDQTVSQWFKERSEKVGIKITEHSFRAYVKDAIQGDYDIKQVFLGHVGKYYGAYTMALIEQMREMFKEASPRLNPLSEDRYKNARNLIEKVMLKHGSTLSDEVKNELAKQFSQGLITMESQFQTMKEQFMIDFLEKVEENMKRKVE